MFQYQQREIQDAILDQNLEKLAILGLTNAGKTSIVKTVLYKFEALMGLAPTKGVERTNIEFLGRELLIWDFGGQTKYQTNYLTKPERFFQGIRYIYYVVDCQDNKGEIIKESADYFLKIFKVAASYSPEAEVFLFFHKIDPNYKEPVQFDKIENKFLSIVLPEIQDKLKEPPTVFHTSIYDPITCISAFSQPLLRNKDIYDTLCKTIKQFILDNKLKFGILFTKNFFEIGKYLSNTMPKIKNSLTDFLKQFDVEGFTGKFPDITYGFSNIITRKFDIQVGDTLFPFYFSVASDTVDPPKNFNQFLKNIDEFLENLKLILRNSEIIRIGVLRTRDIRKT